MQTKTFSVYQDSKNSRLRLAQDFKSTHFVYGTKSLKKNSGIYNLYSTFHLQ